MAPSTQVVLSRLSNRRESQIVGGAVFMQVMMRRSDALARVTD